MKFRIGLIDADLMWGNNVPARRYGHSKADIYPNLALMKLSAYHKSLGDEVEFYNAIGERYFTVYVSKIFSWTPDDREIINAGTIVYGGSGYCIHKDSNGREYYAPPKGPFHNGHFSMTLAPEIEHTYPDYSLYGITDTAYGFMSRGCPNRCDFCHVSKKEGIYSRKVADLSEFWRGQKNIVLMDPNLLACKDKMDILDQLADSQAWVDINQGLDARLLTPETVAAINKIKLKNVHLAWDRYEQKEEVLRGLKLFAESGNKLVANNKAQVYVLTNFDSNIQQDLDRVYTLRDMGYLPYIMVYNKQTAAPVYKSLQRWVNNRAIFNTVPTFEQYDRKKAKE